MTVVFPEAVKAQGNTSVTIVQTVADMAAPKLATEINAGTSVNASCYLYGDLNPTATTAKGEAPRRLCTTEVFQQFGNTTYEVPDITYVFDPQGDDTVEANEAKAALTEGTEVYLVIRRGLNARTEAYATGQRVDVWHVRLGPQNRGATGDGEFDEYAITQSVIAVEPAQYSVAIAT